jgi:hypothetical protein
MMICANGAMSQELRATHLWDTTESCLPGQKDLKWMMSWVLKVIGQSGFADL